MEFNERLKSLRAQASLTQKQLGEIIGVSVMAIRNWESGTKQPSMQAIIALSSALHTSSDIILGIKPDTLLAQSPVSRAEAALLSNYRLLDKHGKKAVETICALEKSRVDAAPKHENVIDFREAASRPARYIPKYTTPSAAGYSVPLDGDDFEMILVNDDVPYAADFAVRIQGDSMAPYINDGDTVYVKKTCDLDVGDVGIFSVDGAMYCKLYYIDEHRNLTLVSANPELKRSNVYVSAESGSEVMCCGKVLLDKPVPFPDYFLEE